VINLDGNITYYGMGSEIMFGWRKNEIIFKHASILHAKDETSPTLPFILEEVKRSGQCELEVNLVKKDGQSFPVILTASKFLDTEGRTTGYIFIAKDITERKKLEYQIFQAEKLAAIGQLAAGMAHEVNNPLFVISGRLEVLLGQKRLASKVKESLETINAQADRIRKLVDRMLKFSRQAPPRLEAININDVIENVLPLLSYQKLTSAKVDIEKDLEKGLPLIKGDLSQLQEVFVNLFINAYQSMAEGGKLTIKTSNFENSYAQILISDTGCGIPQQSLKNLFMPFFSTKKEGTGLGLSICYNIIKSHNGSIDIETQVNKGTTFIIKLPFAKLEKENLGV
jgi:two-component system NtrC family sensor kinase